jgi:pimeloyl-ACP methyl ester carboxylesterase
MDKRIVFVHGRGEKPLPHAEHALIVKSIVHGVSRVAPDIEIAPSEIRVAYYADLFTQLEVAEGEYDAAIDALFARKSTDLTRENYLAARSSWHTQAWRDEASAVLSPMLKLAGFSEHLVRNMAPELQRYLRKPAKREAVLARILETIGDDCPSVLLIGHSLGAVFALDALNSTHACDHVDTFLTLGAPLGDACLRRVLRDTPVCTHAPDVDNWFNFAAEDDHVAHRNALASHYHCANGRPVQDVQIENFFSHPVHGANPHKSYGYLDHPRVGAVIARWWMPNERSAYE